MTSFEEFLGSIGAEEVEALSGKGEDTIGTDTLGNTPPDWEYTDDNKALLEALEIEEELEDFDPEAEEVEEAEEEEGEELEEEEEGAVEVIEDWDSEIELPNGQKVSARDIQAIENLTKLKIEVLEDKQAVRAREDLLNQNANFTEMALNRIASQLQDASTKRQLTESEIATFNVLNAVGVQISGLRDNFKKTYATELQKHDANAKRVLQDNLNTCLTEVAEFSDYNSRNQISDYLKSQGVADPDALYRQIGYDVKFMKIIRDAAKNTLVRNKVSAKPTQAKTLKGKVVSKEVQSFSPEERMGVSSVDMPSYKQFRSLGL